MNVYQKISAPWIILNKVMIRLKIFGINISISFYFIVLLMLLLIIDRKGVFVMSLLAVFLHEAAHLFAMLIIGVRNVSVQLVLGAVKIKTSNMLTEKKKMIISLFGPLANLILASFLFVQDEFLQMFGASNLVLSVFNILPVKGLDGGDILEFVLRNFKCKRFLYFAFSLIFICLIIVIGLEVFFHYGGNPSLIIVGIYLIILNFSKI